MPDDDNITHHDENTLQKVYQALLDAGIYGQQAVDAVSNMQNRGIYFREKKPARRGRPPKTETKTLTQHNNSPATVDPEQVKSPTLAAVDTEKDSWTPLGGNNG